MPAGRSEFERRSHFTLRVVLFTALVLPPALLVLGVRVELLPARIAVDLLPWTGLTALGAFIVSGWVLYRKVGPFPDPPSDDGGGGGGGSGRDEPPPSPTPGGGIPLPDAAQSRARVRDHERSRRLRPPRRRVLEPERPPARTVRTAR